MADTKDLNVLLDAHVPIIGIETPDEERVLELLLRFSMERSLSFYEWTATRGLQLGGFGERPSNQEYEHTDPEELLKHIQTIFKIGLVEIEFNVTFFKELIERCTKDRTVGIKVF